VRFVSSVRTVVMTRAACLGLLQYLICGAIGERAYFASQAQRDVRVAAKISAGVETGFDGAETQPRRFAGKGEHGSEVALLRCGVGVEARFR